MFYSKGQQDGFQTKNEKVYDTRAIKQMFWFTLVCDHQAHHSW